MFQNLNALNREIITYRLHLRRLIILVQRAYVQCGKEGHKGS